MCVPVIRDSAGRSLFFQEISAKIYHKEYRHGRVFSAYRELLPIMTGMERGVTTKPYARGVC
jgi:hypothetical protein